MAELEGVEPCSQPFLLGSRQAASRRIEVEHEIRALHHGLVNRGEAWIAYRRPAVGYRAAGGGKDGRDQSCGKFEALNAHAFLLRSDDHQTLIPGLGRGAARNEGSGGTGV